jgi:hypothetical protein
MPGDSTPNSGGRSDGLKVAAACKTSKGAMGTRLKMSGRRRSRVRVVTEVPNKSGRILGATRGHLRKGGLIREVCGTG